MRVSNIVLSAALALAATSPVYASETSEWPTAPSRLELSTPYGTLHVSASEYVYESQLMLDDDEIQPAVKGLLNIPYAFSSPDFHIALISIDTGEQACPVSYTWVKLEETGYSVTPPFGSCSEQVRVSTEGGTFSLQTPNVNEPSETDHYVYDGKTVTYQKPASSKANN